MKHVILIVDDDKNTRDGLERALGRSYTVRTAESAAAALAVLSTGEPVDLMLSDVRMPGGDGVSLVHTVHARYPQTLCILLTAYGSVEVAVAAMKEGAYDFLMKPVNLDHLDMIIARALESRALAQRVEHLEGRLSEKFGMKAIIGESDAMKRVFRVIQQAAPTQATVLIQGPSGTGKELVAQAIHQLSGRAKGPFIGVHCAALSPTLLESELFGHEKGAFTGAISQRRGRFELADGGTLFLDEISEIDPAIQVKLLRVLEERSFERVGGDTTLTTDIRIIAATNRDLRAYVAAGKFREDLFFRLNVVDIVLPPLSARAGDVPLLADRFLREFREKNNKTIDGFTSEAMRMLCAYAWPGNVRELRNTVEKMVVLTQHTILDAADVPENVARGAEAQSSAPAVLAEGTIAATEREKILTVLKQCNGNKTRAAEALGICRRTLHRKLREYRAEETNEKETQI